MMAIREKNKRLNPRDMKNIPHNNRECAICNGKFGEKGIKKIRWNDNDNCFQCGDCRRRFNSKTLRGS